VGEATAAAEQLEADIRAACGLPALSAGREQAAAAFRWLLPGGGCSPELSDDIRGVFDRMLAADDELEAQRAPAA
jgi:hypothetical protein